MKVTRYLGVNKIFFLPFEQPLSSPFSRRGNVFPLNPWKSKFCSNLWPNLGQLKSCQEFHNSPNLLFQESCLLLTTDHANLSPRIFFPPLYLLSFIVLRAILRFLCRSLSLSLFSSSPLPLLFSSQLSLFTGALHEFLIDQRHEEAKHSKLFEHHLPTISWESSAKM